MNLYIPVPRDLSRVKAKVFFNLTKRQIICFGLAALIGVPSFFLLKTVIGTTIAMFGMMAITMPCFLFAMYEKNGQPLEVILKQIVQTKFVRPKIRVYQTKNQYAAMRERAVRQEERSEKKKKQ